MASATDMVVIAEAVTVEIAKLRLEPGDRLVVNVPKGVYGREFREAICREIYTRFKLELPPLVMCDGITLSVMAAEGPPK